MFVCGDFTYEFRNLNLQPSSKNTNWDPQEQIKIGKTKYQQTKKQINRQETT